MKKKKIVQAKPVNTKTGRTAIKKTADKDRKKNKPAITKHRSGINSFPVVGIGGSAGGQEAFSVMLENLPADLGMSYIYIQHLSPNHESFLTEILQRKTRMPVVAIKHNMPIRKDHVYVIPAQSEIDVSRGMFKIRKQEHGDKLRTIDNFLHSLARSYRQKAIGVILSGNGADGTSGLMAIKEQGGITFAQDDSANYPDMPHNAADAGWVDLVMPADKIAKELAAIIKHPYAVTTRAEFFEKNENEFRKILLLVHKKSGADFSHYKETTIHRRIMRRMALKQLKDLESYTQLLKENKTEVDALYQDLLITVTSFFRDPAMYQALTKKILPSLLKNRKLTDPIRIWIPGCATGEEAVSIAIVLQEYLGDNAITTPVQIFATDLNGKSIEKARSGIYLKTALQNVSPPRLRRFFVKIDGHYQVLKPIRDMCIFAPHNLLKDPPFSRMDVISCQNVLIYLESAPQNKIMHTFHYALKPTGYLLLGKSESIGGASDLFEQPSKEYKVYTKRLVSSPLQVDFSIPNFAPPIDIPQDDKQNNRNGGKETDLEKETDKLLLTRYVPASVLINKDLEILRFRGSTSRYIEPASGKASLHLLKMVREELAFDLRTVIHRAKKEGKAVKREGIIMDMNGGPKELTIEAIPVRNNSSFFLIVFNEKDMAVTLPGTAKTLAGKKQEGIGRKITSLEAQLKEARDSIKIINEDFEFTREELQSANEEVLSSNEELQSMNEELETSKEELQSTNEELTTINDELQSRNDELREAADFAKAIIETMHESLLLLTSDLKVKSANKGFYQSFHVTPEETEGSYLYELGNHQWDIPELRKQLNMVQTRDIPFYNFEVTHNFPFVGLKSMLLNAHKFPMRERNESMILLAVQDLTEWKRMEESLRDSEERFRLLIQNASDIITVFDQDGTIKYESPAVEAILGYKAEERVGRNINMDPIVHPDDRKAKIDLLKESIAHPKENIHGEFRLLHKDGSYRTIDAIFRNLLNDKKINGIIANYRDITDRKILENQKDEFIGIASQELKTPVTSIKTYGQILKDVFLKAKDKKSADLLGKMNTQVDRLTTLIVDLLDFTRIEGGTLKFREEEYNINELIKEVTEEMQRTAPKHKIIKKLSKQVKIVGDRNRTGQVLTNFISNAIKYSPAGKKIIVSSKSDTRNVTISVEDFGIGIKEEMLKKVFDRFFRITQPPLNTFPGLGLGLYVAAEFVKRQGGKIWVKSVKGKGATFFISLPLKRLN